MPTKQTYDYERERIRKDRALERRNGKRADTEPCEHCGVPCTRRGMGAHVARRHPETVTFEFICDLCGEAFRDQRQRSGHETTVHGSKLKRRSLDRRAAFVRTIATLPYHDFVKELLKPWPPTSSAASDTKRAADRPARGSTAATTARPSSSSKTASSKASSSSPAR